MRPRIRTALLLALLAATAGASEMPPVPVEVQLPLFAKIWKMDRAFAVPAVTMAIVYQEKHGPSALVKTQVAVWTERDGRRIRVVPVAVDEAAGLDALRRVAADVFYIAPLRGTDIRVIADIARARKIRTVTGIPHYVSAGVSVGVDVRNDRPLILINLPASRAEGSSFPAQLLQLAKILQ